MLAGAHSRRRSIASSTLLVLVLAGCCFCSPARPPRPQSASEAMQRVGIAENTTGDQKEPKKLQKGGGRAAAADVWWTNPCAMRGGAEREPLKFTSSEEDEVDEMGSNSNLTAKWVIQLRNAIVHIRKIEKQYQEVSSHQLSQKICTIFSDSRLEFTLFSFRNSSLCADPR
jgi:hypothetical protein